MTAQEQPSAIELRERLATGPLTTVWRCGGFGGRAEVCAKLVSPTTRDRPAALRSLAVEQQVRESVAHPNVLPLLAVLPGPVLVGPFVPDGSLDRWSGLALPPAHARAIVDQVAAALDALHAAGWVHGDVSAGNVLCDWDAGRVWLADFGAAQRTGVVRHGPRQVPRTTGSVAALREGRVDPRDDLRAFAALVDHCLPAQRSPAVAAALRSALDVGAPDGSPASAAELVQSVAAEVLPADRSGGPAGAATVDRLAARLESLDAGLSPGERAALRSVLRQAEEATVDASVALTGLAVSVLGPAETLTVFEESGLAHALAAGALDAGEAARRCRLAPGPTTLLLDLMAALSVVERATSNGRPTYALASSVRALYLEAGDLSRPVAEARRFWAGLRTWLHTDRSDRALDDPDGSGYAELAEVLGTTARRDADVLAQHLAARPSQHPAGLVVDVGAGSGVWGRAVQAASPGSRLVLVDRPGVLVPASGPVDGPVLRVAADWRALPLRRGRADLVVLANVCHLEDPAGAGRLVEDAAALLRAEGRLVVVDAVSDDDLEVGPLLQSIHLGLRTLRGRVHAAAAYGRWFSRAGLALDERLPLPSGLTALVARAGPAS